MQALDEGLPPAPPQSARQTRGGSGAQQCSHPGGLQSQPKGVDPLACELLRGGGLGRGILEFKGKACNHLSLEEEPVGTPGEGAGWARRAGTLPEGERAGDGFCKIIPRDPRAGTSEPPDPLSLGRPTSRKSRPLLKESTFCTLSHWF